MLYKPSDLANPIPKLRVEGGSCEDDLREVGGCSNGGIEVDATSPTRHSVQCLRPPLVAWHAEPWDGGRHIPQLRNLLLQAHPHDQVVHSLVDGQCLIAKCQDLG